MQGSEKAWNSIQLYCHYTNTGLYSITKHGQAPSPVQLKNVYIYIFGVVQRQIDKNNVCKQYSTVCVQDMCKE